jgi:glucosyl-3-phosphoglycerate synthase
MSGLRAIIAIPARDEEALIGRCLRAIATQRGVARDAYAVVLVLDGCTDATRERALQAAGDLRLHVVESPPLGVGAARRMGMEIACERLLGAGAPDGLVVTTDADSEVDPGWLAALLQAAAGGARAIGGEVEVEASTAASRDAGRRGWRRACAACREPLIRTSAAPRSR